MHTRVVGGDVFYSQKTLRRRVAELEVNFSPEKYDRFFA